MSRFDEVGNIHGRYTCRSHSQPPFSDVASVSAEQSSPTFLNTESNQQIANTNVGDFAPASDVRITVNGGQNTCVRTLSFSTIGSFSGQQRITLAGLTTTPGVLGHRSRINNRNNNSTPCRMLRSARYNQPAYDTLGVVSSSSSNNSLIGRYRSMSGTANDSGEINADGQLQQIPLSHMLRFASLRMDNMGHQNIEAGANRAAVEQTVVLERPGTDLEFEGDTEIMDISPPIVRESSICRDEFPTDSVVVNDANSETPSISEFGVRNDEPSLQQHSMRSNIVSVMSDSEVNSIIPPESNSGIGGSHDQIEHHPSVIESKPAINSRNPETLVTNIPTSSQNRTDVAVCDSIIGRSSGVLTTTDQPFIRFPNRGISSSRSNSLANHNQEPEADHDFIRTSELAKLPHRSDTHAQHLLSGLNQLRCTGYFCDVVLQVGKTKLPAHRNVLASSSQYFYAMFTGGMCEAASPYVQIQGIDAGTLIQLIDFIYTGEISITEDTVQTLLPAANLVQLTSIRDACCEFLQSQLHPSNCLGIQRFADMHDCAELLTFTRRYTEQHFGELLEQDDEFLALPFEQLYLLIGSDRLAVSEVQVFEAILRWIDHDHHTRRANARAICGRVRFSLLPRDYLVRLSQSERFLANNPWCKDYLIEALSYHLLSWDQKMRVTSERAKPRNPVGLPKILLVLGGQAPKAIRSAEHLDFRTGIWHCSRNNKDAHHHNSSSTFGSTETASANDASSLPSVQPSTWNQRYPTSGATEVDHLSPYYDDDSNLTDVPVQSVMVELPSRRCRFGVAAVGGLVYVVGGFNGALRVRSVEVYDPIRNTWHSGPNMECRRSTLGVAVLNGHIYAVGGFDGSSGLNSAEVFDIWSNSWRFIAPMSCRRSSVGAAAINGLVYAVGGYDGVSRRCLSTVECYNPISNTWSPVADLTCRRSGPAVCELNNRIYAVGGHDGPIVRNTAEVYSPDTGVWQRISDLVVPRRNAGLVAHDGCLYIVGGEDGETNLSSVEKYDVSSNTWLLLPGVMSTGRSYAGCTIIERFIN